MNNSFQDLEENRAELIRKERELATEPEERTILPRLGHGLDLHVKDPPRDNPDRPCCERHHPLLPWGRRVQGR